MPAIAENLASVRERLASACARSGRRAEDVTLVAVTKTVTPAEIGELYRQGVRDFGENRVADGLDHKNALARPDARWHLIGHLQRNKAREALAGGYALVHSVESDKLIAVLQHECEKLDLSLEILIEANLAGEEAKYGAAADELSGLAEAALKAPRLRLRGLMTMAPFTDDPETSRPYFSQLRLCRDRLCERFGLPLAELSMGMTGDFEVAAEEGATMVRVGTALFR